MYDSLYCINVTLYAVLMYDSIAVYMYDSILYKCMTLYMLYKCMIL